MPKNPKQEREGSVEKDQKEHGYYYDDAHGYEKYTEEEDEELGGSDIDESDEAREDD